MKSCSCGGRESRECIDPQTGHRLTRINRKKGIMHYMDIIEDGHISGPIKANLEEIKKLQENKGPVLTGLPSGFTHPLLS